MELKHAAKKSPHLGIRLQKHKAGMKFESVVGQRDVEDAMRHAI